MLRGGPHPQILNHDLLQTPVNSPEGVEVCQPSLESLLAFLRQEGSEGWVKRRNRQSPRSNRTTMGQRTRTNEVVTPLLQRHKFSHLAQ